MGPIAANSPLLFSIEVVDIESAKKPEPVKEAPKEEAKTDSQIDTTKF